MFIVQAFESLSVPKLHTTFITAVLFPHSSKMVTVSIKELAAAAALSMFPTAFVHLAIAGSQHTIPVKLVMIKIPTI